MLVELLKIVIAQANRDDGLKEGSALRRERVVLVGPVPPNNYDYTYD